MISHDGCLLFFVICAFLTTVFVIFHVFVSISDRMKLFVEVFQVRKLLEKKEEK
jgi:hypothetical protein